MFAYPIVDIGLYPDGIVSFAVLYSQFAEPVNLTFPVAITIFPIRFNQILSDVYGGFHLTSALVISRDTECYTRVSVSRTIKYFSVADQDDITITAPFNCIIEVDAWYENQWPYNGGSQTLAIQTPSGLTSLAELVGRLIYGDVIGRTLHAFKAFSGGIKNTSYKFQMLPKGGGTNGSRVIIVKCIPIN